MGRPGAPDTVKALDELQEILGLDPERAEAWVRRIRAERSASGP